MALEDDRLASARAQWRWRGLERPAFAEVPASGQMSVWDFPRPPALVREPREILVRWGDTLWLERVVHGRFERLPIRLLFICPWPMSSARCCSLPVVAHSANGKGLRAIGTW
jgi:hypothetical protein